MGNVTFEHPYINAGFDYLDAKDQTLATAPRSRSQGLVVLGDARKPIANGASLEALLRYDHFMPNTAIRAAPAATSPAPGVTLLTEQEQNRTIAVWRTGSRTRAASRTAIMLDYDGQTFNNIMTAPVHAVTLHGLINF